MSFTKDKSTDNYMTNKTEWERIKEYIPNNKKIWSPFFGDGKQKEYFKDMGYDIIHDDEDFFENNKGDIIIDNIPFSKKKDIFKRLKELDKPFILICPSYLLSLKFFQELYKDQIQILVPYTRIKFKHIDSINKNYTPPYASFFFCYKMNLQKDLIFI
tara:strand:- start:46 stop:519 length:474 start_codon:yes stop_codon:yes gene_type:complete